MLMAVVVLSALIPGRAVLGDEPGIAVKERIDYGGSSVVFDTYHSSSGPYNPGSAGSDVVATVNETGRDIFVLYSRAVLKGDAYIGPGGDADQGIRTWSGSQITGVRDTLDDEIRIPSFSAPTGPPFSGSHSGDVQMWGSQTLTIDSDRYYNRIQLWGNSRLTIDGEVTILLRSRLEIGNNAQLIITPGSRLSIYIMDRADIGGKLNPTGDDPSQCYIYMIGQDRYFDTWGASEVHAVLQNPDGRVRLWSWTPFYGRIKAKRLEGFSPIHIDLDSSFQEEGGDLGLFTDVSAAFGFEPYTSTDDHDASGFHWGDLDNDGDLDAIVTGNRYAQLMINDLAASSFDESRFGGGDRDRQGGLLDFDNDGDLDFWHCQERMYINDGAASFSDVGSLGFSETANNESVSACDVNHDGKCDIVMFSENGNWIGFNNGGSLSGTNDETYGLHVRGSSGNGDFCSAGDVNDDGYLDFFYHFSNGRLFLSDGDGTYTQDNRGISVVTGNSDKIGSAWGDYDNDGDLDLFVPRYDDGQRGYLWRNDGERFVNVTISAGVDSNASQRSCCWGDYDNDGYLDLYITTTSGENILYHNQGDGTFLEDDPGASAAGNGQDAVFVDYDNDGDLDLALTREDDTAMLFRNNTNTDDYLKVRVIGDGECATNLAAIGVKVELFASDGETFIARREVGVARGFGGAEPIWLHFGGVNPAATYYVKVHFNDEAQMIEVVPGNVSTTIGSTTISQMLTVVEPPQLVTFSDVSEETGFDVRSTTDYNYGSGFHWADLDDDGDLDAIVTGNSSSRLLINNNLGQSFFVSTFGSGGHARQGALLDIDNDGDIDFWHRDELLYQNNGAGSLSSAGNLGFSEPSNNEAVAAADVNADGWCDIVMFSEGGNWIGMNQAALPVTLDGTNSGDYGLHVRGAYGNGDYCSSGDANNDGRLDFFYNYRDGRLFMSDGDGTYTQNNQGISVVTGDSDKMGTAWGDYDNDGDLDLFVPRYDQGEMGYLWRNDGGAFANVAATAGVTDDSGQRSACWGDYDNDGDLDLYIVTHSNASNVLYENQGNGTFQASCAGAEAPGNGHDAVFVDYDNDGDLDLAVSQEDQGNTLLENATDNLQYLKVRVIGAGQGGTNKAGVGTRIELFAADGSLLGRRDVGLARGFGGGDPLWVHFGGVDNSATYVVKVHFISEVREETVVPASASTTIGGTTISQMLTVEEPSISDSMQVIQWVEVDPGQ